MARRAVQPLGFSFRNTAREAGLTAVTVFGGTETNKYLLETTGCWRRRPGLRCGWLARRLPGQWLRSRGLSARRRADQSSVSKQARRHLRRRDGQGRPDKERVGAGGVRRGLRQRRLRRSVRHVLGTEPSLPQSRQQHLRRRDCRHGARRRPSPGGVRGAPSSTTIATAAWTCSRPITSTSISPRRPFPSLASVDTRASPSRAGRRGFREGRTCCTATRARARSRMCPTGPASPARRAPTGSASARSISTTTAGSICMSPTTRIPVRCI